MRKREKKFGPEYRSYSTWARKLKKKKAKKLENSTSSFRHYFYQNRDETGQEREKNNFSPEFRAYPTLARKFP